MTLAEAIEEVKRENEDWGPWHLAVDNGHLCTAIATILNAVVKGELVNDR